MQQRMKNMQLSLYFNQENASTKYPQLLHESKVLEEVKGEGLLILGIPKVYWSGIQSEFNIMVIDLLGPSLEELFKSLKRKFTLKTVLMIGQQLV